MVAERLVFFSFDQKRRPALARDTNNNQASGIVATGVQTQQLGFSKLARCVQKILGPTAEEDYLCNRQCVSRRSLVSQPRRTTCQESVHKSEHGEQTWQIQLTTKETGITLKKNNRDIDPDTVSRKSTQKQRGNQSQQSHL